MDNYITEVDILDESKDSFLTYSAEVLTDRAIPAAEDGLLSAQRKLIWTMEEYLKTKCNEMIADVEALLKQLEGYKDNGWVLDFCDTLNKLSVTY